MIRIAGLDPGKQRDSFAFVGTDIENGVLKVLGAKRWLGKPYLQVEADIENIHRKQPFKIYILEVNNTGTHVLEILQQKHIPVHPVFTSKDIKDLQKKEDNTVMDKNEMVRLMAHWFQDGSIVFPVRMTPELEELKRQLTIFAEHKTEAGTVSYRAEGQEHDDLVMALMLACWYARKLIGKKGAWCDIGNPDRPHTLVPLAQNPEKGMVWTEQGFRYR